MEPGFKIIQEKKRIHILGFGAQIAWSMLILVLLATGFILVWNYRLDQSLSQLDKEFNDLQKKRDKDLEAKVIRLDGQLKEISKLLNEHPYWSKLFKELEDNTLPQVQFTNFEADLNSLVISMASIADSYGTIAKQIVAFEEAKAFSRANVSDLSLGEEGKAEFKINVGFDRALLNEK